MNVTVVAEYVPWRLHLHHKNLTYEQALFLLEGTIHGLRQLFYRFKNPFLIEKYMIGLDAKGEVKVWWNENFFKNKQQANYAVGVELKDMALSLVNCLALKMDYIDS